MGDKGPKITADNDKITIAFNKKIRLGPLHTLVESYLQLSRDQQRHIDDLLESFLSENNFPDQTHSFSLPDAIPSSPFPSYLPSMETKIDRVKAIVQNRTNPNFLTAREIQELYERYLDEKISIGHIQTYLTRLIETGDVERQDDTSPLVYRIISSKIPRMSKINNF